MARALKVKRSAGATLAEALVSLGLATVTILVMVELATTALRTNQKGSDLQIAGGWAGQKMESFVSVLPSIYDPFWSETVFTNPYQTDSLQIGNTTYQSNLFLTDQSTVSAGLKMVTLNVSWYSGSAGRTGYGQQVTSLTRLIYAH